jgi:diguanylate cyclase (GGDEF)-like protein
MATNESGTRILVYAPGHHNGEVIARRLRQAHIDSHLCNDLERFEWALREEAAGLDAVVVTAAALRDGASSVIAAYQRKEPAWSSLPLILLAPAGVVNVPPWPHTTVVDQPTTARQLVRVLDLAIQVREQQRRLERANRRLEQIAYQDTLTGLANRVALYDRIRELQRERRGARRSFSAVFLDIDDFKRINDDLGHQAGDDALRQVALHLAAAVRSSDYVARWGGDEFIVLLVGEDDANDETVRRLARPVDIHPPALREPIRLSLSVGRLDEIDPAQSPDEILSIADTRMYEHKYAKRRIDES